MQYMVKWCEDRERIFCQDTGQCLPLAFSVYQEYILAIDIGSKAANQIDEGLHLLIEKRYKVKLCAKAEASLTDA